MDSYPIPNNKTKEVLALQYLRSYLVVACDKPVAILMAGIPGAGKTEYAKDLADQYLKQNEQILLIDLDEIRALFPGYTGKDAHRYQNAASVVMERIIDKAIHLKYNFILDGTLQKLDVARKNLTRLLSPRHPYRGGIEIHYVIRDKTTAWEFTQKRERIERRKILKETFEEACNTVMGNVKSLKAEFGNDNEVHLIVKPPGNKEPYTIQNISESHPLLQSQSEL